MMIDGVYEFGAESSDFIVQIGVVAVGAQRPVGKRWAHSPAPRVGMCGEIMLVVHRSCGRRRSHPRGLRRAERSGYNFDGFVGWFCFCCCLCLTSLQGGCLLFV